MTMVWRLAAASMVLVGGSLVASAAPANAGAGDTGCPGGYETLQVSDLLARGYDLEFTTRVDANVDGVICGKPLSERQQEKFCEGVVGGCYVDVIYGVRDNTVAGR